MRQRDGSNVIDLSATMKRLGGDEELLNKFIEVFNEDAPCLLDQLSTAVEEKCHAAVARAAHSLRGLAANFDANRVIEIAATIEEAATQDDLSPANDLFDRLSDAVDQVSAALQTSRA